MTEQNTIATQEIKHSPLGASGSGRWMHCPGSIQLAAKLGIHGSESSFAAKEGTAAHEILSKCIEDGRDIPPSYFEGCKVEVQGETFEVDLEMINALDICYRHIQENLATAKAKGGRLIRFIEVSMKHSKHDLMFGTTDCGIVAIWEDEFGVKCEIWVNDLKYGAGIVVEPTSSQIKYYAELIVDYLISEGIIESHSDVNRVTLTIMQPRIPHTDGLIRSVSMSGDELESWYLHELVPAMQETENPDAVICMGSWCTFCPVKSHCPAMAQAVLDLSVLTNPKEMTNDQLGEAIQKIDAIVKLGDTLKEMAFKRAMCGQRVKGFKLVKKKANRQWRDIAPFDLYLQYGDDAFSKSLLTPPQVEKLHGGKEFVAQYAFTPKDVGLTLAPLSDNRVEAKPLLSLLDELED